MFSFGVDDLQAAKNPPPPPSISAMDEEAQKRNTDCIYFLASPLTCKKGTNCEYRHSEAARMNPRDCWYWKSNNCLNARCSFRHLPLEGKPGCASASMPTASGASTSTAPSKPQLVSATSTTVTVVPSKSKTPCYFFSQGYCAKNEKCPFMHGSSVASPIDTAAQQMPANRVNGKAVHASGRPLIVLKQNGLTSQEARPVTDGKSVALNDAYPISSKAPVPVQGMHQIFSGSEGARFPERVATSAPFRQDRESKKLMIQADRFHDIRDLAGRQRQSQHGRVTEQGLPDQKECLGLAQTGDFRNLNGCRSDAVWDVRPSGGGSVQSIQSERTSQSDSQESMKGLGNSPLASNGQDSFDTYGQAGSDSISGLPEEDWELESSHKYDQPQGSLKHARQPRISFDAKTGGCNGERVESEGHNSAAGDLRYQLTKRRKNDSSPYLNVQHLERRGQSDEVSNCHGGRILNNDHPKQEVETCRLTTVKVDFNGVKRAQYDGGRGSSDLPLRRISPNADPKTEKIFKKVQAKGPASKHLVMDRPKADLKETEKLRHNSKVAPIVEKRPHSSSRSTSKSTLPEKMKVTLTFTGPKSLAQIKAEKMAGGETPSKAIGSHDPITKIAEAGAKLADRKLAVPAESWDVAASDGKMQRICMGTVNKCESSKQKTAISEEFEGPKPLSLLLKRKRDLDSDSDVKEIMSGPIEVKGCMTESFEELEDGEVGDDDNESKEEDLHDMPSFSLAPPQEDSPLSPSNTKEEVLQGLQRSGGEAAEPDMESSEDGLRYDMEMEENAYGDEDYEIDDDDEDDFAKKLGRFFA